jgi:hypothetical protein
MQEIPAAGMTGAFAGMTRGADVSAIDAKKARYLIWPNPPRWFQTTRENPRRTRSALRLLLSAFYLLLSES